MIGWLIAAALSAASVPTAATPLAASPARPDAHPALWVINDHDTIIYLFGTFHALDGRTDWFNDEVETAFAGSDQLILETLIPRPGEPMPMPKQSIEHRYDGVPPVGAMPPIAGSASFLSTSKMVMSAGRSRGMSTEQGADLILRDAADQSGKTVAGLESFDFQLGIFSRLPSAAAPADARQAQMMSSALAAMLARLQDAWNRGDIDSFAPMLEEMRVRSPETYRLLFLERNRRWAAWIASRLDQPGTVFVAVGAGHLAGNDSVQRKLASVGIRSARIN